MEHAMNLFYTVESIFSMIVQWGILFLEFAGVAVLLATCGKSVADCLKRNPHVRLKLAQGIALSLEFKLGSEILRTVVVRDWKEIGIVAGIIALRAALTFLIHWEINAEEKR